MGDPRIEPSSSVPSAREASLYVQKTRVPARLSQPNLDPRDGWFQLDRHGSRPETLIGLLNSRRSVIPFILAEDDPVVLLVARANIDWIAVGPNVSPDLVLPPVPERTSTQRVELRFVDESRVEATIEWPLQHGQIRLSDFLNACDGFVASTAGFGTLIWNKERIREVRIELTRFGTTQESGST